jgi:hypothetical protein
MIPSKPSENAAAAPTPAVSHDAPLVTMSATKKGVTKSLAIVNAFAGVTSALGP